MADGAAPFLVDVREQFELIAFGAIPGVVNIPLGELASRIGELPSGREIVVVCQSGNRSVEASNLISRSGFAPVFNLLGGTSRWVRSGYPVSHPSRPMNMNSRR